MRVERDLKNLEGLHWKLQGHCGGLWLEGEKNAQVSESRLSVPPFQEFRLELIF